MKVYFVGEINLCERYLKYELYVNIGGDIGIIHFEKFWRWYPSKFVKLAFEVTWPITYRKFMTYFEKILDKTPKYTYSN